MDATTISKQTARRYILGRQGLWPGRRWRGKQGVAAAIEQMQALQIDSVVVVARNHEIALWSRVLEYNPADLDTLLYGDRAFFDYGNILMIYPLRELPYWRPIMERQVEESPYAGFAREHPEAVAAVREQLRRGAPLGNRDFGGKALANNGRAGKETGLALYYLWACGELMTQSRRNFERLYAFREDVIPPGLAQATTLAEAEAYFERKALLDSGLTTARGWSDRLAVTLHRRVGAIEAKRALEELVGAGVAAKAQVEGSRDTWYFPEADIALLPQLEAGDVPAVWQPLEATTADEVTLLAPLDNAIWDRARTQAIFDFDYAWEIYKPAAQRRWGYYTLPILYGDRLVARLDPKLDRSSGTLQILGFWLDDQSLANNAAWAAALARGLDHFARFLGATSTEWRVAETDLTTLVETTCVNRTNLL